MTLNIFCSLSIYYFDRGCFFLFYFTKTGNICLFFELIKILYRRERGADVYLQNIHIHIHMNVIRNMDFALLCKGAAPLISHSYKRKSKDEIGVLYSIRSSGDILRGKCQNRNKNRLNQLRVTLKQFIRTKTNIACDASVGHSQLVYQLLLGVRINSFYCRSFSYVVSATHSITAKMTCDS